MYFAFLFEFFTIKVGTAIRILQNHVVTSLIGDIHLEDMGAGEDSSIVGTPLKFNMEPEKKSLEK